MGWKQNRDLLSAEERKVLAEHSLVAEKELLADNMSTELEWKVWAAAPTSAPIAMMDQCLGAALAACNGSIDNFPMAVRN